MFFRSIIAVTLSAAAFVYAADVTREVKVGIIPSPAEYTHFAFCSLTGLFLFLDAQRRDHRRLLPSVDW